MPRPSRALLPALALLAGCGPIASSNIDEVDIDRAATTAQESVDRYAAANRSTPVASPSPGIALPPLEPPAPGEHGGLPDDRTPISEAPFTADSAQGAANVVQQYYALIEQGKYSAAWVLWDNNGAASGLSRAAFAASFAKYSEYHANVGAPGEIDAGAGQRYVTVPVQAYGRLVKDGAPFVLRGDATLHRTGDIDGATAAQKSWHLRTADLKPVPAANHP